MLIGEVDRLLAKAMAPRRRRKYYEAVKRRFQRVADNAFQPLVLVATGSTDPTAADHNIAIVNYRGLTRSDRTLRVVQSHSWARSFSNGSTVATVPG